MDMVSIIVGKSIILLSTSTLLEELSTRGLFECIGSAGFSAISFGCATSLSSLSTSDDLAANRGTCLKIYRGSSKSGMFGQGGLESSFTNTSSLLWLSNPSSLSQKAASKIFSWFFITIFFSHLD
jgi:hypothetical protein